MLGRHFERVLVPAHVRDKYKILMADREFAVVSGHTRRLFPPVRFHFWPQRRHHTGILFLSCKLPRNRSRQNSREPKRQTSVSSLLLEYDLKSRGKSICDLKLSLFFSLQGDKSTVSTLREGPFCSLQNILYVITHEGNFMRANQVCVWFTAVICVRNGFFLIIGSAEALPILCVRYFRWERERDTDRERERERRKWRHHCRAKIGDEFTLSLAKNSHNWRWAYAFPCQNYRKRGSASYIVREVLSVRERERERDTDRERERERDGSDVTIVALKLAMNLHFPLPKIRTIGDELTLSLAKIIGSAEALPILCVRHFRWERERYRQRERERERGRERDGSDVTIVALKLRWIYTFPCQKFAQLAMSLRFPLPKNRTFRFSLHTSRLSLRDRGEVNMVALKFAMSSHFPLPKIFSPTGFIPPLSNGTSRASRRDEWSKTQLRQMIKSCPVLFFFPSKKWIKLIPKTIGNRKRDCAWGGSGWYTFNTWENLQIAKHKSGRRSFSLADWFVLCDLSIFSGKVYHPEPPHAQSLFLFPIVFGINNYLAKWGQPLQMLQSPYSVKIKTLLSSYM